MNKEMRTATAPHRYKNRSATRKEKIVYTPFVFNQDLNHDRFMNLEKFMMMIQRNDPTGEMFLRKNFTPNDAFKLLAAIAERMKSRNQKLETVAVNAV